MVKGVISGGEGGGWEGDNGICSITFGLFIYGKLLSVWLVCGFLVVMATVVMWVGGGKGGRRGGRGGIWLCVSMFL